MEDKSSKHGCSEHQRLLGSSNDRDNGWSRAEASQPPAGSEQQRPAQKSGINPGCCGHVKRIRENGAVETRQKPVCDEVDADLRRP